MLNPAATQNLKVCVHFGIFSLLKKLMKIHIKKIHMNQNKLFVDLCTSFHG